jgi:hypothetical protein
MKRCFSFCIYGTDPKYYLGLQENVRLIDAFFPDFDILVYRGATRRDDLLLSNSRVQWIDTEQDGVKNMMHRYKPILEYDVVFVRDVDSEIHARDRWCIHDFLNQSTAGVQVIRDHYWHKSRITGGLTAFFMSRLPLEVAASVREALQRVLLEQETTEYVYGSDENQLNAHLWSCVKDWVLVYSNICVFSGEVSKRIDGSLAKEDTFCGNVVLYDDNSRSKRNQFRYGDFPMLQQWIWLLEQDQHEVAVRMVQDSVVDEHMLDKMIETCLERHCLKLCLALFAEFSTRTVTQRTKEHARSVLELARRQQYRIVGTCNVDHVPQELEMVVVYGNFPDDYLCLPQPNRKMFQHVLLFDQLDDFVGAHPCWNAVDCIYIMGLENEKERMTDVWIQLCLMNAPLYKVREYRAKKDPTLEDVYIGVTKNHIDCLNHMRESKFQQTCLFLEDDFVFTSRFQENQEALLDFFSRDYDYELCFLSASKMHRRLPWDDLLIQSKQICTTSSGYLVHRRYIDRVYQTVVEGYNKLLEHRSQSHLYCIDRYWAKLDKIFVFKNKLGFQKPSLSKITGNMNMMLD